MRTEHQRSAGVVVVVAGRVLVREYWHRGGDGRWSRRYGLPKGRIEEVDGEWEVGWSPPSAVLGAEALKCGEEEGLRLKRAVLAATRECAEECGVCINGWPEFLECVSYVYQRTETGGGGGRYEVQKEVVWFKYDGCEQWPGEVSATVGVDCKEWTVSVWMAGWAMLGEVRMEKNEKALVRKVLGSTQVRESQCVRRPWVPPHALRWHPQSRMVNDDARKTFGARGGPTITLLRKQVRSWTVDYDPGVGGLEYRVLGRRLGPHVEVGPGDGQGLEAGDVFQCLDLRWRGEVAEFRMLWSLELDFRMWNTTPRGGRDWSWAHFTVRHPGEGGPEPGRAQDGPDDGSADNAGWSRRRSSDDDQQKKKTKLEKQDDDQKKKETWSVGEVEQWHVGAVRAFMERDPFMSGYAEEFAVRCVEGRRLPWNIYYYLF